jgi:hypothetical protein
MDVSTTARAGADGAVLRGTAAVPGDSTRCELRVGVRPTLAERDEPGPGFRCCRDLALIDVRF